MSICFLSFLVNGLQLRFRDIYILSNQTNRRKSLFFVFVYPIYKCRTIMLFDTNSYPHRKSLKLKHAKNRSFSNDSIYDNVILSITNGNLS